MKIVEKVKLNSYFKNVAQWRHHAVHHLGEIAYQIKNLKGDDLYFSLPRGRELMLDINDCGTFCSIYTYGYEKYIETNNDKYFEETISTIISISAFDLGYSGKPFSVAKLLSTKYYLELLLKDPYSPLLDSLKKNNSKTESEIVKLWKYLIKHQKEEEKIDKELKKYDAEKKRKNRTK
jgi:hypothetical protein